MKNRTEAKVGHYGAGLESSMESEIRRANAKLRHFRGVAAGVMSDALKLWMEVWDMLQDGRSYEEILYGSDTSLWEMTERDRAVLLEKLQLVGIKIDYARRLCEGSIGNEPADEGGQ